jgi:hypothetical protein
MIKLYFLFILKEKPFVILGKTDIQLPVIYYSKK